VGTVSPRASAVGVEDDLRGGHDVNCKEDRIGTRGTSLINQRSPNEKEKEYVDAQICYNLGKTPLFMVSRNVVEGGVD
jgi:hypothetical protein